MDWKRFGSTAPFCPDQLPVCPSSCGSEHGDTAQSEDTDQTVGQQHHPHLPHLLLSVSPDPDDTDSAGTRLRLHCRCDALHGLGSQHLWLWPLWCCCVPGIFNYYHLSLLLTSLNCLADPALYCFVSESARRGLYIAVFKPVGRMLFCWRHHGNVSSGNPVTESHEVATEENNGHPTAMLLTQVRDIEPGTIRKTAILISEMDGKTATQGEQQLWPRGPVLQLKLNFLEGL